MLFYTINPHLEYQNLGTVFAFMIVFKQNENSMRINKTSEAVLAKYAAPKEKVRVEPFYKTQITTKKGSSLQDFYEEVNAKSHLWVEQVYSGKNAHEIELMMMEKRKLIESKRTQQY